MGKDNKEPETCVQGAFDISLPRVCHWFGSSKLMKILTNKTKHAASPTPLGYSSYFMCRQMSSSHTETDLSVSGLLDHKGPAGGSVDGDGRGRKQWQGRCSPCDCLPTHSVAGPGAGGLHRYSAHLFPTCWRAEPPHVVDEETGPKEGDFPEVAP